MKKSICFCLFVLSFLQCSHDSIPVYSLIESKRIDVVCDTLLFRDIKCLTFHDDKLYFVNPVDDQIISLNKTFCFEKIFGKKGQGPNELLNINQFAIHDSLISVLNVANRRINIFSTNGTIISETPISNSLIFDPSYRYCFVDTDIIGCSSVAEVPLSKYDIYTKELTLFGKTYEFSTPKQTSMRNNRFTAKIDSGFIVVSNNQPYIEIYDKDNLERTFLYDYSDILQVKKTIRAIEKKTDIDDNSYRHLCEDVYVTDRHIYILLIDYSNNDFNVNQIIKFEIYPTIKPVSIYKLPGKYFTTFCVSEESGIVYAYHYTMNTLGEYLIDKK